MESYFIRSAFALLFAVLLASQARASADRPRRRLALSIGATAMLCMALSFALPGLGVGGTIPAVALYTGMAGLAAAGVLLLYAIATGEARGRRAQFDAEMRAWRDRREKERSE